MPRSSMDAVIDCYKRDLDMTLIEANLRRTPEQRIEELQRLLAFAETLERAGRARPTS